MSTAAPLNNEVFHSYLSKLSGTSHRFGIKHQYDPNTDLFSQLPNEAKSFVISNLKRYTDALSELETRGVDIANTRELLKHCINYFDFRLPPGVFEKVAPTDQFEIFASDYVPLFKSPNGHEFTSYGLEKVFSKQYHELYARDEFYQASISRIAQQILKGVKVFVENPVPEHTAWELDGPFKVNIKYRLMSPFYHGDDNEPKGILVVHDLKLLS